MKKRWPKVGDRDYRHPYAKYEETPLWPLVEKGIRDLVKNEDLIEKEDRNYIVGYLCKVITAGEKRRRVAAPQS